MVTLLGELCRRHPEVSLGLAITADEERGSHHGTRYLVDQELSCDLAILPDGGSFDIVVVAEKGPAARGRAASTSGSLCPITRALPAAWSWGNTVLRKPHRQPPLGAAFALFCRRLMRPANTARRHLECGHGRRHRSVP